MIEVKKIPSNNNILTGSASQLVVTRDMTRNFGSVGDYVELHISDPSGKVVYSLTPFTGYTIPGNFQSTSSIQELTFDPTQDLKNIGIQSGKYNLTYNILRPVIVKDYNLGLFISEISGDRTEIRLTTNNITSDELVNNANEFISSLKNSSYFKEFYLNFGRNQLITAVNIALDFNKSSPTVLIKLLDPLPIKYNVNDLLNVVDEISNPQKFSAAISPDPVKTTFPTLRGPNFDLDLDNLRVGPTPYYNFNEITTSQASFAPLQKLLGQLSASNFALNVDYTDYEEFVHYSSAARRLEGFKWKLQNIETTSSLSSSAAASPSPVSNLEAERYQTSINKIIQSFDGYEQYLYYTSGTYAWPKQNSTKPYINYSVTASQAITWYNGNYDSASLYDENNQNYLLYTLPGYIAENTDNELAFQFVASVGQMFDDIWIHIKAITDLYQAKNALDQGISKDLVYFALQSLGINVYTDQDGKEVFQYLYGISADGTYKPMTGSYETLISASNYQTSGQDQQKEVYKRIYHNLPLLLKSKGTTRFVQYLNTIFGIPDTIMGYTEYGGVDKITSSFEYEYNRFTYALKSSGSNAISIPWNYASQSKTRTGYSDIAPNGIEFRFKASPSYTTTQSLFYSGSNLSLNVLYTNTGSNNSIYSGTIGNFGYLQFKLGTTVVTSSTVPVFTTGSDTENDWYNVLIQRRTPDLRIGQTSTSQTYDVYIKNNVWGEIGHVASASLTTATAASNSLWYTQGAMTFGGGSYPFSGSLQEIRLWSNYVSQSTFDSHVLNPESIEGNTYSSSFSDLMSRFTLGNNLYTYNHSLTSSVNSTHPDQKTQILTATFTNFPNQNNYTSFTETYYADAANSGYANPVNDKIRIISGSNFGTTLSAIRSIQSPELIPTTKDIHLLDSSLSPQDEIDRAIIAAFGSSYSIDDIIGNPATGSYSQLQPLQNEFFKKFTNKYNYKDYIRLIEFFHNSLFRTLKDFTPARTNLSSGIVIKPHLLERPVIYRSEPTFTHFEIEGTIDTAFISASNGGNYSQSVYPITYKGNAGDVTITSDARDFFTGELPSSSIDYHKIFISGNKNPYNRFDQNNTSSVSSSIWNYSYNPLFNNVNTSSYISNIRQKITWINSGSKLIEAYEPSSIQDFTYDYARHARPRYFGSNTTSINFNFGNQDDYKFGLNRPLGKNATIDDNSIYFGYFAEAVCTGSQLIGAPERTNLYLKYLIDGSGSLNELFQRNYDTVIDSQHYDLYRVQSIFKPQETLNVSLFDNQSPSHQKSLDGNHTIFASGIKYYPTLWRADNSTTGSNGAQYSIPTGYSTEGYLKPSNYRIINRRERSWLTWSGREISVEGDVEYYPNGSPASGYLAFDITVQIYIDLGVNATIGLFNGGHVLLDVVIPAKNPDGSPNYKGHFRHDSSNQINNITPFKVTPTNGIDPGVEYVKTDTTPQLTVNSSDKRIVSCSALMSELYPYGFYFSGSVISSNKTIGTTQTLYNSFCPLDYNFQIGVGDLIRFTNEHDTGSITTRFRPENEYTIIEAYTTGSVIAFKLDREVQNAMTSSTAYKIERYVFSRKIIDETNVVILHEKREGQTSAGIAKNIDLRRDIDENVGNIVSELKSKIFSTVLKQ